MGPSREPGAWVQSPAARSRRGVGLDSDWRSLRAASEGVACAKNWQRGLSRAKKRREACAQHGTGRSPDPGAESVGTWLIPGKSAGLEGGGLGSLRRRSRELGAELILGAGPQPSAA